MVNAGLLDQAFALAWVQKHACKFGGDRKRVTITGESAGAGSVMYHALAADGSLGSLFFTNVSDQVSDILGLIADLRTRALRLHRIFRFSMGSTPTFRLRGTDLSLRRRAAPRKWTFSNASEERMAWSFKRLVQTPLPSRLMADGMSLDTGLTDFIC